MIKEEKKTAYYHYHHPHPSHCVYNILYYYYYVDVSCVALLLDVQHMQCIGLTVFPRQKEWILP